MCAKKDAHVYERLSKLFNGSAAFVFFPFLAVFVDVPFAVDIDLFFDSTRSPDNAAFRAIVLAVVGAGIVIGDKGNVSIGAVCLYIIHIIIVLLFFLLRMQHPIVFVQKLCGIDNGGKQYSLLRQSTEN